MVCGRGMTTIAPSGPIGAGGSGYLSGSCDAAHSGGRIRALLFRSNSCPRSLCISFFISKLFSSLLTLLCLTLVAVEKYKLSR